MYDVHMLDWPGIRCANINVTLQKTACAAGREREFSQFSTRGEAGERRKRERERGKRERKKGREKLLHNSMADIFVCRKAY